MAKKKVWIEEELWDVERVFHPTKFDTYLLVSKENEKLIHEDSKTVPVDMILIDANNDEFLFSSEEVDNLMEKVIKARKTCNDVISSVDEKLNDQWLEDIKVAEKM